MKRNNYSNFSKKYNNNNNNFIKTFPSFIKNQSQEDTSNVANGFVSGCKKLYIRKGPSLNDDYIAIINQNDKLTIFLDESTNDFYKVKTKSKISGYCMKLFVELE